MHTPLFARQPIFNRNLEVIAYELLFRNSDRNVAGKFDGDHASSHVLLYAFGEHRIEDIIGKTDAFINFTQNLLSMPPPLPANQLVIEVLEDVSPTPQVIDSLKTLKKQGYRIALDDFFITKDTKELIAFADIIKIDVLSMSEAQIRKCTTLLKPLNIQILAEKVETHEIMQNCIELGFDAFQGYFLSKPQIIKGVKASQNKAAIFKILSELTSAEVDFDKLVDTIATDPRMTYKILNLVNSSAVSLSQPIDPLKQAVALLGLNHIRNWTTFLLLASDESKPTELSILGTLRAKFCEILGANIENKALGEVSFTAGLLSSFDALLDMTIETVVSNLNLAPNIEQALIEQEGKIGKILQTVFYYEKCQWDEIDWEYLAKFEIDESALSTMYTEALTWSTMMVENSE